METGLEALWNNLSLTEDEQKEVIIEKEWVADSEVAIRNCLVGKMVINRAVNLEAMKSVLQNIWKVTGGLIVKEVGEKIFVFQFEKTTEKDRTLMKQPWSFNKSLLVLQDFDGFSSPKEINMEWCPFWVQIHGLPLSIMTEKIGIVLGEDLGEVLEVETSDDQLAWGRWMRVRVNIHIKKPLKRGKLITDVDGRKVLAMFKYERLPDFCYMCGKLDHQELDCTISVQLKKDNKKAQRQYGPWLRAEGPKFSSVKFEDRKTYSQDSGNALRTVSAGVSVHQHGGRKEEDSIRRVSLEASSESRGGGKTDGNCHGIAVKKGVQQLAISKPTDANVSRSSNVDSSLKVVAVTTKEDTVSNCNIEEVDGLPSPQVISQSKDFLSSALVEIPIADGKNEILSKKVQSKWKRKTGKENIVRGNPKKISEYLRRKRTLDYGNDSLSKRSKDVMEVDLEGNTSVLAEVGETQPRQSL